MEYLALILFWFTWCAIHSVMISLTVKDYLKSRLGRSYRFYRLFYSIVALTTLIPLALYSKSLKGLVLFRWQGHMIIVQGVLLVVVMALAISGLLKYDVLHLFGFNQIKSGKSYSAQSKIGELDTSGILGLTRHPWYLAVLIFIWIGYREMYVSTLIVNIILTIYVVIGTVLEERKLIVEFGDNYRVYRNRVSMLFPLKWISAKLLTDKQAKSGDP